MPPVVASMPSPSLTSLALRAFSRVAWQTLSGILKSRREGYTGMRKLSGYLANSAFCPSDSLLSCSARFCAVMTNSGLSSG